MEIETLRLEMSEWPVEWRWEGTSGHPRRITDNFVQALEDEGFTVDLADVPVTQGPLGNVGEFEGAIVARWKQPSLSALRRKWFAAAVGVVLLPVIVGIFIIKYALDGRRHLVAIDWRGEAYPTTARAGQANFGAERTGIVSDVRVTLRGAIMDANKMVRDLSDLQPALNRLQWEVVAVTLHPHNAGSDGAGRSAWGRRRRWRVHPCGPAVGRRRTTARAG